MICILILGMHRSGTSAFAGALNLLGVSMGKELLEPAKDNPKGFYENKKITFFNEYELLPKIGKRWDDLSAVFLEELEEDKLKEKAYSILVEDYKEKNIWGIKDPRLCILFPFWEGVIKKLNAEIRIIIPYRNPVEVAFSLFHRDRLSIGKGLLLWAKYNLYAEYYSRKYRRIFVSYDELLKDPIKTMDEIQNYLEIPLSVGDKKKEIKEFLDRRLKKFNLSLSDLPENTPSFVKETAYLLEELSYRKREDSSELRSIFDSLKEEYEKEADFFCEDLIGEKIQLFWKDRNRENFALLDIKPTRRFQEISYKFPENSNLKLIALKLLNKPCILEIERISLVLKDMKEVNLTSFLKTNALFIEEKRRFVFSSEPEIFISENPYLFEPKELRITFRYLHTGKGVSTKKGKDFLNLKEENERLKKEKDKR